ncbi:hypothetical protein GFK82_00760 [Candidatus Steffania adelgidicola]|nr:hypothetical protein GFK82_00760 [Candidatus Steffania adelgidicola]
MFYVSTTRVVKETSDLGINSCCLISDLMISHLIPYASVFCWYVYSLYYAIVLVGFDRPSNLLIIESIITQYFKASALFLKEKGRSF